MRAFRAWSRCWGSPHSSALSSRYSTRPCRIVSSAVLPRHTTNFAMLVGNIAGTCVGHAAARCSSPGTRLATFNDPSNRNAPAGERNLGIVLLVILMKVMFARHRSDDSEEWIELVCKLLEQGAS